MADSLFGRMGFPETGASLGNGSLIGAAVGAGTALLGVLTSGASWLSFLIIPLAAVLGGVAGDAIAKDGPVFGERGLLKKTDPKPTVIPGGYLSPSATSQTYAVSSEVIVKNKEAYSLGDFNHALDMRDDPRLERLEKLAEEYGRKNPPLAAGATMEEIQAREKKMINLIVKDMGREYGEYSSKTMNNGAEEEKRARAAGENPKLKNLPKGASVYRHYAAILSHLSHKAGVPNHMVVCHTSSVRGQEDSPLQLEYVDSLVATNGWHATMVTTRAKPSPKAPPQAGTNGINPPVNPSSTAWT